jgi:hypothetical protein
MPRVPEGASAYFGASAGILAAGPVKIILHLSRMAAEARRVGCAATGGATSSVCSSCAWGCWPRYAGSRWSPEGRRLELRGLRWLIVGDTIAAGGTRIFFLAGEARTGRPPYEPSRSRRERQRQQVADDALDEPTAIELARLGGIGVSIR